MISEPEFLSPEEELERQLSFNQDQLLQLHVISQSSRFNRILALASIFVLAALCSYLIFATLFSSSALGSRLSPDLRGFAGPICVLAIFGISQILRSLFYTSAEFTETQILIRNQKSAIEQAEKILSNRGESGHDE
jgi:hypothetical protein